MTHFNGKYHYLVNFSAAHCIFEKHAVERLLPRDILSIFGAHDLNDPYEAERILLTPKKIIIHDDWSHLTGSYNADVCLLEFRENKIHFDDFIQPICLWDSGKEPTVTEGIVTRWSKTEDAAKVYENKPKMIVATIRNDEYCIFDDKAIHDLSSKRTFCGGLRNGSGVCSGDNGGGLFINVGGVFYLSGISSFLIAESSCDVSKNAVFTNVPKFGDWIKKTIGGELS